jgi:excisionase family DNA binding protein
MQDAARMLGISIGSLEHLIARQQIPTRRIGGRVLITRISVESFARAKRSDETCEGESL